MPIGAEATPRAPCPMSALRPLWRRKSTLTNAPRLATRGAA
jgi:hypothetical protein